MNFLQRAARWAFQKAIGFPPMPTTDPGLGRYMPGGMTTIAGVTVGFDNALSLAAVYGCVRVRGGTVGSLPLHIFKDGPKGREKAPNHPLYYLLHDQPNEFMTSKNFREAMQLSVDFTGNAYGLIGRMGARIVSLTPLHPERVKVRIERNGDVFYDYNRATGTQVFTPKDILHLRNFSLDGIRGLSPLGAAREVFGKAIATQQYGSSFFRNSGRPIGVVKMPAKPLSPDAHKRFKDEWRALFSGSTNAGETAILYEGSEYQSISIPPDDAQFIETHKLNVADIACIYGVPLNLLGYADKTATYASAEQFDIQFAKHTIRPLTVGWEQELNRSLIAQNSAHYAEFDMEGLMRGDAASQANFISTMVQNGVMTRNEARRKFNLPDVEGADELTVQSNMIDVADLEKLVAQKMPAPVKPNGLASEAMQ